MTTKNIFRDDKRFESILPKSVYERLARSAEFVVTEILSYVGKSDEDNLGITGLERMRLALDEQKDVIRALALGKNDDELQPGFIHKDSLLGADDKENQNENQMTIKPEEQVDV